MSAQTAHTFIDALHALEDSKDAEPMAALYTQGSVIGNVHAPDGFHGPDGARQFWTQYRGTFQRLHSEFRNVIATETRAALEWTTTGEAFDGKPFEYSGVTILETEGEQVTRSCAYFDPAALGRQIEPHA